MKNLELEIQSENSLKAYAKVLLARILPQLEPFIGKKIFTANGSKTKSFESAFLLHVDMQKVQPEPIEGMHVQSHSTYFDFSYGKFVLKIGVCLNGGSHEKRTAFCKYADRQIDLGVMKDGQTIENLDTLENIVNAYGLDNLLNLETELTKIKEYKELQAQADKAKSAIRVASEFYKYID